MLDEHCLAQMARFKRPKRYVLVDDLPKNNYGKVLKTALRERWPSCRLLTERMEVRPCDANSHFALRKCCNP